MTDILSLIKRNRLPKRQSGQIIESKTAFFIRYYHTIKSGERKQKCEKLADKGDLYRSKNDVRPLAERFMQQVNSGQVIPQVWAVELVQDLLYSSRADPHSLGLSSPNAS